jgi:hypothetical protein
LVECHPPPAGGRGHADKACCQTQGGGYMADVSELQASCAYSC